MKGYKAVTIYAFMPANHGVPSPYIEAAAVMVWRPGTWEDRLERSALVDLSGGASTAAAQLLTRDELLEVEGGAAALLAWQAHDHTVAIAHTEASRRQADIDEIDDMRSRGDAEAQRLAEAGYPEDRVEEYLAPTPA